MPDNAGFEYTTLQISRGRAGDREINKMALAGWEVATRSKGRGGQDTVTFKRDRAIRAQQEAAVAAAKAERVAVEEARRAALSPEERKKEDRRKLLGGAVIAALIVGFVIFANVWDSGSDKPKQSPTGTVSTTQSTTKVVKPPAQVKVPLVTGWRLDKAQAEIRALHLGTEPHDCSGRGEGVWRGKNWRVDHQDPEAGTTVPERTVIKLCVPRISG